ncbi:hypothetical protein JL721_2180 [Aureococcus anophagefferens]|nr:hypothetical protein JL721_2180 [Aureococcus anophagefferens]
MQNQVAVAIKELEARAEGGKVKVVDVQEVRRMVDEHRVDEEKAAFSLRGGLRRPGLDGVEGLEAARSVDDEHAARRGASAAAEASAHGDKVGVYDNRNWKHLKPHLDEMIRCNTVRISPLPPPPPKKRILLAGGAYTADVPYAEACYDAAAAESYFAARPLESLGRLLELARVSGGFVANAVGQALSIRSDLVPAAYVAGLTQLQDSVAPFPAAEGRRIIEDELGISVDETFSFFSTEPVASASIGQVYRARLRSTGEEVALKVQRPKVLREVALDVYLLRRPASCGSDDFREIWDLQLSLLEFIADLSADEYERVPDDLVKLGFVPEDKIDDLRSSGLTYGISTMLKLAAEGGGPKGAMQRMVQQNKEKYADALRRAEDAMGRTSSTTADITSKIEELQQQNANVFAIPEYFLYMSRAFATLEGIGLSSDENYAILKECFPYLAKRLLSDDSPRARGALRTLLYGADGTELKLDKLRDVATGLQTYSSSTVSVASGRGESDAGLAAARDQIVDVVFGEKGSFVQDLILREAAVGLDAKVREALNRPFAPLARLPALGADLLPLAPALPLELLRAAAEVNELDATDARRLETLEILASLFPASPRGALTTAAFADLESAASRSSLASARARRAPSPSSPRPSTTRWRADVGATTRTVSLVS